jgi:L-rhamnose mutarotase
MKRFCFALDLVDNPGLIAEYIDWHQRVWPEIKKSIADAGVRNLEIYRVGNRMFMIMETEDSFTLEKKAALDNANQKVQEWEDLMWKYQKALPFTQPGEKWKLMDKIFDL